MRRILSVIFAVTLVFSAMTVVAQEPPQETAAPALTEKDVKKVRAAHGSLSGTIKDIRGEVAGLMNFRGKDEDLAASVKRLKKSIASARKDCQAIAELAKKLEWSKAPKLAVRMSGELETLEGVADILKSSKDITTGIKGELRQSDHALKTALKKLGAAPPVAVQ